MTNPIDPISYNAGIEALKPCPFCGSPGEIVKNSFPPRNRFRHPTCTNERCVAVVSEQDEQGGTDVDCLTDEEAIKLWNTRSLHRTEPQTAPASCPNCADETDCSNVRQCRAVEEAYAAPADAERLALAERIERNRPFDSSFHANLPLITHAERDLIVSSLRAGDWREDLDRAPRDGTQFLGAIPYHGRYDEESFARRILQWDPKAGAWYDEAEDGYHTHPDSVRYWMPLPSAAKNTGG